MSTNPRDTQFLQSARQVIHQMLEQRQYGWIDFNVDDTHEIEEYATIIAQYAYDLVSHVIAHAPASVSDADDWTLPDMAEWPKGTEP